MPHVSEAFARDLSLYNPRLRCVWRPYPHNEKTNGREVVAKTTVIPLCGIAFTRWRDPGGGGLWYRYLEKHPEYGTAPWHPPSGLAPEGRYVIQERAGERWYLVVDLVAENGELINPDDYPRDLLFRMLDQRKDVSAEEAEANIKANEERAKEESHRMLEEEAHEPYQRVAHALSRMTESERLDAMKQTAPRPPPSVKEHWTTLGENGKRQGFVVVDRRLHGRSHLGERPGTPPPAVG